MKPIYKKLMYLFSAIIAVHFIYAFYSVNNYYNKSSNDNLKFQGSRPPSEKFQCQSYDAKITGLDSSRLGYAILPQFQIKPKTWKNVLKDVKPKLSRLEKTKGKIDEANSTNSNSTSKSASKTKKPETSNSKVTTTTDKLNIKPKKILVYEMVWWGSYNKCTKDKKQNLEYPCEYSNWSKMKKANKSLVFADVANNFDAVVKYRDYSLRKTILSLNSKSHLNSTCNKTKLIYNTMEAPGEFQVQMKPMMKDGPRDLLASYWRGSDIYTPYFRWVYHKENITSKHQTKNYAAGRTKMAAIVVSNCKPHNNRLGFVKELQKYIEVDIFGKCGTFPCPKKGKGNCFSTIKKNYKFYLSFENTMCRDYITEKLGTNGFGNELLPVVMGAHPSDYKAIAPLNSYIHVEDFESIEELGRFLLLLHRNDHLYNSYFAWKGTGAFHYWDYFCEYCAYLHAEDARSVLGLKEFRESSFGITPLTQEKAIPYLNMDDTYDIDVFNVSRRTEDSYKLCLGNDVWYWNS